MNLPISIKGVVFIDGKVILLKNERDEWELPGGRLEADEKPEECVAREIKEELNVDVKVNGIIDSWVYPVLEKKSVFIVTYFCELLAASQMRISHEHKEMCLFSPEEISALSMPENYKRSIYSVM